MGNKKFFEVEYFVCFSKGDHWITRFLKKNFGHVFVVVKDEHNWLQIEPLNFVIHPKIVYEIIDGKEKIPVLYEDDGGKLLLRNVPELYAQSQTVIKAKRKFEDRRHLTLFGMMHCTGITKRMLGIKAPFVQTPYQLCKYLLKKCNGEFVHPTK